ncbi:SWIM zinc finger family protein [Rhizobium sp. BK376]|uniref:SWIM zinc finger family protein n=1 Tax=Rhizobium sp. BK376 TaxID=2512149 RepID=UPI0010464180|nr:putative Zn finger protein [Rhizobium sp. BK376]
MDTALDENAVRALATAESFARGRDYVRHGAVLALERRGDELIAEVEGSEYTPYVVTVELLDNNVAATQCSCHYDWGGACKHVVAVLLKYIAAPDAITQKPSVAGMLEGLDREALVELLVKRAKEDTAFIPWLETELATGQSGDGLMGAQRAAVDPEPIRRQAKALLSGRGSPKVRRSDDEIIVDEEAFGSLIDRAKPFLEAGDGRNALNILEAVTETLVPVWRERADWDETLHAFFPVLGQMIAEAVLMSDLLPAECDELMMRIDVWQGMLYEYGLEEHLQVAIDALDQGWDEMGLQDVLAGRARSWPLSGGGDWTTARLTEARLRVLDIKGDTEAFLNLASAAGRHGDHAMMLIRLGRIADAQDHARNKFRSAEEVLEFARLLKQASQIDAALDIAEWWLTLRSDDVASYGTVTLARWLRDIADLSGRRSLAFYAARAAFERSLSLGDFRATAALAGAEWSTFRSHLLASLAAAKYARDRTEIYLGEGMVDEAVQSVDLTNMIDNPSDAVLMQLADAAHASHSDWVIEIAGRMAAGIMEAGRSAHYDLAARWLEMAARAYDAANRFDDWMTQINLLIERHRRKHKLRPLLEALRPRR